MRLDRLSAPRSEARLQLVVLLLLDAQYLLRLRAHLRKRGFAAVLLVSCKTGVPVWVVSSAAAVLAPRLRGKTALQLLLLVSKRLSGGNRSLPLDCLHLFQRLLVASHRTDPRPPIDRGALLPEGRPPGPTWDPPHVGLELWYPQPLSLHGGRRRKRSGVPGAATPGHPPARRGGGSVLLVSRRLCGCALLLDFRPRLLVSRDRTDCVYPPSS